MSSIFDKIVLNPGRDISEYESVTISLQTAYAMGSGWTAAEKYAFESEVYPAMEKLGFSVREPHDKWGGCPDLVSPNPANKLCLYMHPETFTGYAKMDDVDKIIEALRGCESVKDARLHYHEPVYDISDYQYKDILLSHSKEFIKCMQEAVLRGESLDDIGFEFARENRIPRIGDGPGISFSDVDVQAVKDIYKIAKNQGLLEKDFIKAQFASRQKEEEKAKNNTIVLSVDGLIEKVAKGEFAYDLTVFTIEELDILLQDVIDYREGVRDGTKKADRLDELYLATDGLIHERENKEFNKNMYVSQLPYGEQRSIRDALADVYLNRYDVDDVTTPIPMPGDTVTVEQLLDKAMEGRLSALDNVLNWRAAIRGDDYDLDEKRESESMKDFMLRAIKEGVEKFDLSVFTTPELDQLIDDISDYRIEMGRLADNINTDKLYESAYNLLWERQTKNYNSSLYICQLSEGEQRTLEDAIVDVLMDEFGVSDTVTPVDAGGKTTIGEIVENAMAGKLTDLSDTLNWRAALKGNEYTLEDREEQEVRE